MRFSFVRRLYIATKMSTVPYLVTLRARPAEDFICGPCLAIFTVVKRAFAVRLQPLASSAARSAGCCGALSNVPMEPLQM